MNIIIISIIFGTSVLLSTSVVIDDAFGSIRDTRETVTTNQINTYSNYVHFQPEWNSYPRNLIVDVSTSWEREFVLGEEDQSEIKKSGAKIKQNTLQYVNGKPVVSVQFDYRDCETQWIHYARTSLFLIGNQLEKFEPKSIPNISYSDEEQKQKLANGFATFVPICTSKESTNYEYTVSINDKNIGFDVYFVPSYIHQWSYFLYPQYFDYYSQEGCFAQNFQKYSGFCNQVAKNSGLLVLIPDELSRPMTKISVELTEK
ncbi:MAG: hypothetical protein ACE5RI_05010 [Candidatus Nitrosomaritimum yanchengensis]